MRGMLRETYAEKDFVTLLAGKVYGLLTPDEDQALEDYTKEALNNLRNAAKQIKKPTMMGFKCSPGRKRGYFDCVTN